MWRRPDFNRILGIVAAILGVAILILSIPWWIWTLALGVFLIWFGWKMYTTNR